MESTNGYPIGWGHLPLAVQKGNRFAIERHDKSVYGQGFDKAILSREAFERIRSDGNHKLPLADLMRVASREVIRAALQGRLSEVTLL